MKCPYCRQTNTEIYNTRTTRFETQTWRRHRCQTCNQSFTTYESVDLSFLKVTASNSQTSRYSRAKLYSSIYAAFRKVPQKDSDVDAVTDTIEAKLLDLTQREISRAQIVRIVLSTLKHFNTSAFLSYLSRHTEFTSGLELARELKKY